MSEALGPLSYGQQDEQIFLGREIAQHRDYSEETAKLIDSEISRLVKAGYQRAKDILEENRDILDKLTQLLLEKETVMGKELDELIYSMRPGITLPSDPTAKTTSERAADSGKETESPEETGLGTEAEKETEPDTEDEKTSADVENP